MSKQRLVQLEEQSENNALAVIETTIQDVLKAYYTAQLQNDRRALFSSILDLSRERHSYYELKEKYSNSNSLELLQFKNQYLTDSTNLLLQQISYNNSLRNLGILMNDSTLTKNEVTLTDKIDVAIIDINFEDAKNEMLENNKNLKNQYIALELQKTNTSFSRSFLYPTLNFQAGINPGWSNLREINNSELQIETNTLVYYGNFSLRYSLFNNWKNKRAVEVSKIQEEIAALNIESIKSTLSSSLKNLIEMYHARIQLVSISEENLIYAKMAFELAQKRFDLGTINSIDLASFQNTYQNTTIQHYENLFNKLDIFLEINKLTGKIGLEYTSQK
jgi:outer membrane protein TolC